VTTLTPTRLATMPRVNLLPPEIAEAARLRRLQMLLGLMVLGAFVVVVLAFLMASGQVGGAEDDLADAEAQGQQLESDVAGYAEAPEVTTALTETQTNLATTMTPEIRWSFLLNDLSLVAPRTSRLSSLTAVNTAAAAQLDPVSSTALTVPVTPLGAPSMGSVTFTGTAVDFDAVAAWLQSLAKQEGLAEPSVTSVARTDSEDTKGPFYDVETSTQLTPEAASERYLQIANGE